MSDQSVYEGPIEAAYQFMLRAQSDGARRSAAQQLVRLVKARNADRTERQIEALERTRGLRA